jgi:hypothetical protein
LTKDEALKLALEYLEASDNYLGSLDHSEPIAAIKEALAQPAQEPVAWMYQCSANNSAPVLMRSKRDWAESGTGLWIETPLYTTPPQRPWVGLTRKESLSILDDCRTPITYISMIEAKLKEKNT